MFTGYHSARARRRITPEEYVAERRRDGKPVLCNRCLLSEAEAEAA